MHYLKNEYQILKSYVSEIKTYAEYIEGQTPDSLRNFKEKDAIDKEKAEILSLICHKIDYSNDMNNEFGRNMSILSTNMLEICWSREDIQSQYGKEPVYIPTEEEVRSYIDIMKDMTTQNLKDIQKALDTLEKNYSNELASENRPVESIIKDFKDSMQIDKAKDIETLKEYILALKSYSEGKKTLSDDEKYTMGDALSNISIKYRIKVNDLNLLLSITDIAQDMISVLDEKAQWRNNIPSLSQIYTEIEKLENKEKATIYSSKDISLDELLGKKNVPKSEIMKYQGELDTMLKESDNKDLLSH